MEAAFSSQQVTQVGATARRTTVVLPSAARKQQKIAVGDHTGVVTCFTAKRGVHEMVFQSPPGEREVTALSLGGRRSEKSQIYAANGQIIHGFEKKVHAPPMRRVGCHIKLRFTCSSLMCC